MTLSIKGWQSRDLYLTEDKISLKGILGGKKIQYPLLTLITEESGLYILRCPLKGYAQILVVLQNRLSRDIPLIDPAEVLAILGSATTTARHCAREIATLMRF